MDPQGRPTKRRRTSSSASSLPTPPSSDCDLENNRSATPDFLSRAVHILVTEAAALSHVTRLYQTDATSRHGLERAVRAIVEAHRAGGKLIVCGVGKSAYIGMKLVATCKSLGIGSSFLHACEAAHGDLGDVRASDVLLFVSYSGRTPELMNLLPYVGEATQVVAMSSQTKQQDCPLLTDRETGILLPAPVHEKEEESFGVAAPTTSTTVALAVADMLALTIADQLHMHHGQTKNVFKRNHPGGAIGMNHQVEQLLKDKVEVSVLELPSPSILEQDAS